MLVANRFNDRFELGDKLVIPIDKEEYNKLSEISTERKYADNHGFVIITLDSGFTQEQLDEINERIKVYFNDNKLDLR